MTQPLPASPDWENLRKQAKALRKSFQANDPEAVRRVAAFHPRPPLATAFQLSDAQLTLARELGFPSWPKLKQHVLTATAEQIALFKQAVEDGDAVSLDALLMRHPALKTVVNEPYFGFDAPAVVSQSHNRALVDVLLRHGADINARSRWWAGGFGILDGADEETAAALMARGARLDIHAAAGLGMREGVEDFLRADPKLVHARGGDGKTPLHFAKTPEIAALLLEAGAELESRDIDHGSTPAQYAAGERPDVCRFLLERGAQSDIFMLCALGELAQVGALIQADPDLLHSRTSLGPHNPQPAPGEHIYIYTLGGDATPLMVAANLGSLALAEALLAEGANVNEHEGNATALHLAAWAGHADMVRFLLEHGADPTREDRTYHSTPAGWAEHNGQTGALAVLREATGQV
ncbi:MAG: ankyrin repeat domain-containing protein [Armatimonadota bacterium]|nr:ankyrin repeat domain-containing protein [Armatimonadota bacterium]